MTALTPTGPHLAATWWMPTPANWRLALIAAVVLIPGSILALPLGAAFWVSFVAVGVVAFTVVFNAWGRHNGPLLVAPAITLLFVMNIFPLLWSFGLSFFRFRANRLARRRSSGSTTTPR